jgi:ATP/ADP translocase
LDGRAVLASFWDVRPGERARTALMFSTVMLLIAAYTTTKAVRDAVFLEKFGLTELSYMMIGIAVAAGFLVSAFTRITAGLRRHWVIHVSHGTIALTLCFMAPALQHGVSWMSWALYFWSGVWGLLVVAEFWLLANDLFHAREAKRLFPLIGAGAILGGVVGGAVSGWLARPLGSANLLYVVAAELVVAAFTSHLAWRRRPRALGAEPRRALRRPPRFTEGLQLLRSNGYVRVIAMMMICMTVCMTFVQWQYKGIAKVHFGSHRDEMTAFFGVLAALLNTGSFLLQMFGTPRLLKRFGVKAGLRVLPMGFLVGAMALLAAVRVPQLALVAAGLAVLLSDGFRFSVDKASVELLYLPIPRATKDQAKPFIDTVVDRFAGALSGFLWLGLTWAVRIDRPGRIPFASVITLAVVAAWLFAIQRARRGYVDAYRRMLSPSPQAVPAAHPRLHESEALLAAALPMDAPERTRALRAMGRILRAEPLLRLPRAAIEPHLAKETETVRLLVRALAGEGVEPLQYRRRTRPLLVRACEEKLDEALERIARLLAMVYPPHDILAAHRALRGSSASARAGAIELLDNLVEGSVKGELLAALDDVALGNRRRPDRADRAESLRALLATDDRWLRACAAFAIEAADAMALEPALVIEGATC